jgi:hypothetical protein
MKLNKAKCIKLDGKDQQQCNHENYREKWIEEKMLMTVVGGL